MKIKAYFITYDNNLELNKTLKSFEKSGIVNYDYEISVINNCKDSPVILDDINIPVKIITNETRPSFSTGHLSRNWNECLIDGFQDIDNPNADIVILSQNDVDYNENIIETLIEYHNKFSFIQSGNGDSFHSYTVESIKSVGLWDERFCNIGWQDCDYFLRQYLYNKQSTINDAAHGRINNPIDYNFINVEKISGFYRSDVHHMTSMQYHNISMTTFIKKWGLGVPGLNWKSNLDINSDHVLNSPQWIMYPFFESKIINLKSKNYVNYETQN